MDSTHTLDFLVIGSLTLLSLALVGLAFAAGQLVPQMARTLTAYEKLANTLEAELAPTIREVNKLAGGVVKLQSSAQHTVAEVGTKVEDVTGNITKVADQAKKESSVLGHGIFAGIRAYLAGQGSKDQSDSSSQKREHSKEKASGSEKQIAMDPR